MKCLEGYTIEQVKEMSLEELKWLWDQVTVEQQTNDMRNIIINTIDVMNAKKPLIES